jgi:hypothetical protein
MCLRLWTWKLKQSVWLIKLKLLRKSWNRLVIIYCSQKVCKSSKRRSSTLYSNLRIDATILVVRKKRKWRQRKTRDLMKKIWQSSRTRSRRKMNFKLPWSNLSVFFSKLIKNIVDLFPKRSLMRFSPISRARMIKISKSCWSTWLMIWLNSWVLSS